MSGSSEPNRIEIAARQTVNRTVAEVSRLTVISVNRFSPSTQAVPDHRWTSFILLCRQSELFTGDTSNDNLILILE